MTTTTTEPFPDIPLPAGADFGDIWEGEGDDLHRVVMGTNRGVTDTDVIVWPSAIQFADGSIDDGSSSKSPQVNLGGNDGELNSDQTRGLASALLEAATRSMGG
jgi:hypothetical protein